MKKRTFATILGLSALLLAGQASAASCEVTVESNDAMQFNTKEITIDKSCKQFTVHLKHVGKMPKTAMGHNLVVVKTADMSAVNKDGAAAGAAAGYLKANDERVIAHTKMLGGGESDSVTFDTSKLKGGEDYSFFCSYPGHAALMKGKIKF